MTDDEMQQAVALANQHIAGHDRPRDEYCPECVTCHGYMETFGMDVEPSAFCDACMYAAADAMATALLAANAECERMRAVYEAAQKWRDASLAYGRNAFGGSIGEAQRLLGQRERSADALADAIDAARAGRG